MTKPNILTPSIFTTNGIATAEAMYNAKYMIDSAVAGTFKEDGSVDTWSTIPGAFFYQEEPYPETGSHYFCLYINPLDGKLFITDGSYIDKVVFNFVKVRGGLLHSVHRHDCQVMDGKMIDGGRDYLRGTFGDNDLVSMRIVDDGWEVVTVDPEETPWAEGC